MYWYISSVCCFVSINCRMKASRIKLNNGKRVLSRDIPVLFATFAVNRYTRNTITHIKYIVVFIPPSYWRWSNIISSTARGRETYGFLDGAKSFVLSQTFFHPRRAFAMAFEARDSFESSFLINTREKPLGIDRTTIVSLCSTYTYGLLILMNGLS